MKKILYFKQEFIDAVINAPYTEICRWGCDPFLKVGWLMPIYFKIIRKYDQEQLYTDSGEIKAKNVIFTLYLAYLAFGKKILLASLKCSICNKIWKYELPKTIFSQKISHNKINTKNVQDFMTFIFEHVHINIIEIKGQLAVTQWARKMHKLKIANFGIRPN